jgi:hypothetical protein
VVANHRLPLDITHFSEHVIGGFMPNHPTDGWGNILSYDVTPDHHVRLTSHGKPGTIELFSLEFSVPELGQP